jgi:hypothetical protein
MTAIACAVVAVGAFDLASRPELGADDAEPVARERLISMRSHGIDFGPVTGCGSSRYDVSYALRSDESTRPGDLEPEGSGPARRRYVRDDPDEGIIRGTVSLVSGGSEVSARQRRRRLQGRSP